MKKDLLEEFSFGKSHLLINHLISEYPIEKLSDPIIPFVFLLIFTSKNKLNQCLIHLVTQVSNIEGLKFLLENGVNINDVDNVFYSKKYKK